MELQPVEGRRDLLGRAVDAREHVITIKVTVPSQPGAITNRVHITSLGSTDATPANDDATNSVVIYTPVAMRRRGARALAPADGCCDRSDAVHFSWAPSSDGARYVGHATIEGAAAYPVGNTSSTNADAALDRAPAGGGRGETSLIVRRSNRHSGHHMLRAPAVRRHRRRHGLSAPAGWPSGPAASCTSPTSRTPSSA